MTTKEVAQICGVTDRTVSGNAQKAGVVLENGKSHDWTEEEVKRLQLVLIGNVQNRGNASTGGNVVEDALKTIADIDGFKYSKEDICNLCGVSISSFEHFAPQSLTERDFLVLGSSHKKVYNEDALKKFQLWLMKNQVNQGVQVETVKSNVETVFELGTLANVALTSGNIEAAEQFSKLLIQATQATAQAKELEAKNQLLLEQKEKAEADYQIEKEEHRKDKELVLHKYLTATQIKEAIWKEYGKNIVVSKMVKGLLTGMHGQMNHQVLAAGITLIIIPL